MNKHYQKAIVVEALNRLRAKGHEVSFEEIWALVKKEYASSEAAGDADDNWGNFESDVQFLVECWEEDQPAEEEETVETTIEEAVSKLHVGFNFIPGIGVGYCSNEEDLKAMQDFVRDFVRGGMAVSGLLGRILDL